MEEEHWTVLAVAEQAAKLPSCRWVEVSHWNHTTMSQQQKHLRQQDFELVQVRTSCEQFCQCPALSSPLLAQWWLV